MVMLPAKMYDLHLEGLTKVQSGFLVAAYDSFQSATGDGRFNRKDVFVGNLQWMPWTMGRMFVNRGLLECDPADHLAGYDLSYQITRKGVDLIQQHWEGKLEIPEWRTLA